jgi:hypothetical protein
MVREKHEARLRPKANGTGYEVSYQYEYVTREENRAAIKDKKAKQLRANME